MTTKQKVTRKLSAILSADVKGYSLLMTNDESATIQTLKEYRTIMSEIIKQHSGRVVDAPGDNMLAEFSSVVNAVQCSVEIQKTLKTKNSDVPDEKRLHFRMGVNIGDVVQDGGSLYGEGVNIAARIEGLADPGGVCISRGAYDHVKNKLNLGYEYIGDHAVKNIKDPVRVYKILMDAKDAGKLIGDEPKPLLQPGTWATVIIAAIVLILFGYQVFQKMTAPEFEPASIENMAFPLPDKPSIAVLPFDNMSGDKEQEYFCDGITEEIITALSKTPKIFVIARNSTFTYKGKAIKVRQVAEELGVQYVLEGSVRTAGDRVRITAQLIDALTGHHLWAERYDRDIKDIFALQDEITLKIVIALQVKLTEGEQAAMWSKRYKTLDVKLKSMEWMSLWRKGTFMQSGEVAQELIDMASESEIGYTCLGWYYWYLAFAGKASPQESIARAFELAQKALSLDENPSSYALLSNLYVMIRQYDKAIAAGERGLSFNPNGAHNHVALGIPLSFADKLDEAINHFKHAIRLNPFPDHWVYAHLGRCYMHKGQYEEALTITKKAIHVSPEAIENYPQLAAIYVLLDRQKEASAAVKKVLEIDPRFSVERVKAWPYKNPADLKFFVDAMRKAGFPEKSPAPLPDKPSIAVLPFDNMSGDPQQEYFSDGITEDIITALSKTPKMFVIARNSTFTYKGKSVNVQEVGRDLGVRYVLEGSVRKMGDTVRITAQLIDAKTGHHLWAEKYDRNLENIFALQDEITKKIITELHVELDEGEQVRIASKGTDNLDAYLKTLQARYYSNKGTREGNTKAKQLVDEAIATAPDYAYAYRILGLTHIRDFYLGMSQSPKKSIKLAMAAYKKAVALDESLASAWAGVGYVLVLMRNYEEAVRLGKKAIAQEPNGLIAHLMLAVAASLGGFDEDAQAAAKEILRIDPQFSVKRLKAPFKDKIHMQIACDALNKAGLSLDCDALK